MVNAGVRFTQVLFQVLLVVFIIPIGTGTAVAQSAKGWALSVTHENDGFSFANTDENYTGGFKVELLTPHLNHKYLPFFTLNSEKSIKVQKFSFGATAFTPQHLELDEVITDDRPYGSFTYFGAGRTCYDLGRGIVINSELLVGKMGGMMMGNLQRSMNRSNVLGASRPVPEGWENQVGHPGSFAFNYGASYTKSGFHSSQLFIRYFFNNIHVESDSTELSDSELVHIDSIITDPALMRQLSNLFVAETGFEMLQTRWTVGANAGLYMDNLYFTLQLDLFNVNRYSLLNYIPDLIKQNYGPLHGTHHRHTDRDLFRFNFFVRPTLKLVGYNATLEGLVFNDRSAFVIPHRDISRVLFEFEVGANLLIAHRVNIIYTHSGRSREYDGAPPWHSWGSVTLGVSPATWNP